MSKLTEVIATMRDAGGSKERLTAGWLDLSRRHKGLHDALKAIFTRKPTTQRLGCWLLENVGARHGELELVGRHSTHAKAWRYAVRADSDAAEVAEAARAVAEKRAQRETERATQREEAARRRAEKKKARGQAWAEARAALQPFMHRPGFPGGGAPSPAPEPMHPAHTPTPEPVKEYEYTTRVTEDGRIVRDLLMDRDGMPQEKRRESPPKAAPVTSDDSEHVTISRDGVAYRSTGPCPKGTPRDGVRYLTMAEYKRECETAEKHANVNGLPPWVGFNRSGSPVQKRQPTRAELAARHHQHEAPANVLVPRSLALGIPGISGPSGVRVGEVDSYMRRLWLMDF
jgi:hypothetical protein